MTVGGDLDMIDAGGTALRECARLLGSWPDGVRLVRSSATRGVGDARGGVGDAVRRWADVYGAAAEDSVRLLDALGVLASSTAADLAAADAAVAAMLAGPF